MYSVGTIAILQISVLPLGRTVIYVHGVGAIAVYILRLGRTVIYV